MIKEKLLIDALNAVSVHFTISLPETTVYVPDKFKATNYPKRTQSALKRLQKIGYHIQTEIQS
ncbi:hypothetical protein Leef1_26 [Polaribacter phage Leef_1]|uniref:Uncharacterized protein n=1 Tax=Polaribacter phage Leef_1 TaxID=2745684 RepID=A0A8E5E9Q1_9CAUD|nr:hypothetical protein M1M28_gp26 [Polaribacter phage Leef_1]QQV91390.1 hypothetical protein Leef1_26 [Polaribacter phage Leef_1]